MPNIEKMFKIIVEIIYSIYLFIGAFGGLYFFIDIILNRMRIKIGKMEETRSSHDVHEPRDSAIMFEITNIGKYITSLEPKIFLKGYDTEGKKIHAVFEVYDINRDLQPHTPKRIFAYSKDDIENFAFLWLKTYTFDLTRGKKKRMRYDSADMNILPYWKYIYKLLIFKIFKHI